MNNKKIKLKEINMTDRKDIIRKEDKSIEKTRELKTAIPSVDIYENDNEILLYRNNFV